MGVTKSTSFASSLNRASFIALNAALLASASIAPAYATVIDVPRSVDPGQLEKRFEQPQPNLPASNLAPVQPSAPKAPTAQQQQLAKKRFVLKNVVVEGATVYSAEDLKFAYQDKVGKEISLLEAQSIADSITNLYHKNDYILSQAILPPQDIKGGTLKIRVVEGYVSNVVFQGDVKENSYRQVAQSYGDELKMARPIRTKDLERYLLLMNDLPGAGAKGLVRPGATPGTSELVVTMSHKTYEGSYTLDNRGTKFVGPWQHTGTVTANSLFGMYDRTLLRVITTSPTTELRFIDLQHEEQIGSEGTRFVVDVSHSQTKPGDSLKGVDIVGESDFVQAKVIHPFVRSRQQNLVGRAMFDARNTDTDVFHNVDFTTDRLRVVRAGGSYDFTDNLFGANLIDSQVSQGVSLFNASRSVDAVSNTKADGTFTKLNLDLSRTQALPGNFSILTSASGQYAFDPLLAAEQFSLGGATYGGAYDPAELSGDHGVAGRAELRYGQTLADYYLNAYQLYGYYDIGRVWIRDAGPGGNNKKSLASVGTGLRTNFTDNLSSNFEVALPLTKDVNNQGDHGDGVRFFFSATARF